MGTTLRGGCDGADQDREAGEAERAPEDPPARPARSGHRAREGDPGPLPLAPTSPDLTHRRASITSQNTTVTVLRISRRRGAGASRFAQHSEQNFAPVGVLVATVRTGRHGAKSRSGNASGQRSDPPAASSTRTMTSDSESVTTRETSRNRPASEDSGAPQLGQKAATCWYSSRHTSHICTEAA